MVSADCEPTSGSRAFGVRVNSLWSFPRVKHLGKSQRRRPPKRAERTRQMVLTRSDTCSRVLGIPHPTAPPPLATWSRTGCHERSNDPAYCFDRGQHGQGLSSGRQRKNMRQSLLLNPFNSNPEPAQIANRPATRSTPVCSNCQSDDITSHAVAQWSNESQEWQLASTFDQPTHCNGCKGPCGIVWLPLH